jgi:hypothetical protein
VTSPQAPSAIQGALVLADISGYTAFLGAVSAAHRNDAFAGGNVPPAFAVMSHLLDGIVERLVPPFTLSKLEGDAVFAYGVEGPDLPRGAAVLACIEGCYADFRRRLDEAHGIWSCRCDACARIDDLDLKFVLHAGPFVVHAVAGSDELAGAEVVLAHRLLKTEAAAVVGHGAYALLTDTAVELLDVPTDGAARFTEAVQHYEPVHAYVFGVSV